MVKKGSHDLRFDLRNVHVLTITPIRVFLDKRPLKVRMNDEKSLKKFLSSQEL